MNLQPIHKHQLKFGVSENSVITREKSTFVNYSQDL